jgi:hypothetical protein
MFFRSILLGVPALSIIIAGACAPGAPVEEGPEQVAQKARELARLEIDGGVFEAIHDEGAELALDSMTETLKLELQRELTEEEGTRVREIVREALAEVLSEDEWEENLTQAYSGHFTASELETIIAFFRSSRRERKLHVNCPCKRENGLCILSS